jgi:hypothetical protein
VGTADGNLMIFEDKAVKVNAECLLHKSVFPPFIYLFIYLFIYFLYIHFKCYPESSLYPPPPCSPTHPLLLLGPGIPLYWGI